MKIQDALTMFILIVLFLIAISLLQSCGLDDGGIVGFNLVGER